jgi:hypothetical protein
MPYTSHPEIVEVSRSWCYGVAFSCKDKEHFIELLTIPATSYGEYVRLHVSMAHSLCERQKANPQNISYIPPVAFLPLPRPLTMLRFLGCLVADTTN